MKTDKLLHLIQQKNAMRSGGALPLPKAQTGISRDATSVVKPLIQPLLPNQKLPPFITEQQRKSPTVFIKDTRKTHPVTGQLINPNRDLKTGNYNKAVFEAIIKEGKKLGLNKQQVLDNLLIAGQESMWGTTDPELGHARHADYISGTVDGKQLFPSLSETEVQAYEEDPYAKHARAQLMNYYYNTNVLNKPSSNMQQRLQFYNTPYPKKGQVTKDTEKNYYKGTNKRFYGVDVTKQPLSMASNPYGKTVASFYPMVANNPEIQYLLYQHGYKKQGGLTKAQEGIPNPLLNIPESQRFPQPVSTTVTYPEGYWEDKTKVQSSVPLNFMGQPYATGAIEESVSPLDFIGGVRGGANIIKGVSKYIQAAKKYEGLLKPNLVDFNGQLIDIGASPRAVRRVTNQMEGARGQMHKGARDIVLPAPFSKGGLTKHQSKGKVNNKRSIYDALLKYKEGLDENKVEFIDPINITSWDDAVRGYDRWQKSNRTFPTIGESMDMISGVPFVGKVKQVYNLKETGPMWYPAWNKLWDGINYIRDEINDYDKKQKGGPNNSQLADLIKEYQTVQEQVNKGPQDPYVDKMREVADRMIEEKFVLELPEDIANHPTTTGRCIGTSCDLARKSGDDFFFYSNSAAQDAAMDPESSRRLTQDVREIEPGSIVQFKRDNDPKKGPYHAYTVYDILAPDENGVREVVMVGDSGSRGIAKDSYYLGPDNKLYRDKDLKDKREVQLLNRKSSARSTYNELVRRRDALKTQIDELDPKYFNPQRTLYYEEDPYKSLEVFFNKGAFYGGDPENYEYDTPERDQTYALGVDRGDNRFREQINLKDSKLGEIMKNARDMKLDVMKKYNIGSHEYDAIVKNMLGVYGAETKFGTDYWGKKIPEPQWLSKIIGVGTVGPFQLGRKNFSKELKEKYSNKDLHDPVKASQAAIEYFAENLSNLRARSKASPESKYYMENVNPANYLEYLPYIYSGQSWLTGDKNTKKRYNDVVAGEHPYKKLVDYYSGLFDVFSPDFDPVEITGERRKGGQNKLKIRIKKST